MDPLLRQFYRQYLQQVTNLTYPPSKLLAHPDIQQQLHRYFFDEGGDPTLPPAEIQRRVLKRLIAEIDKEIKDEDDEVSDDLMAHMGYLSSLPRPSDLEIAQTPRLLSYFLPDPPAAVITTSSYDNAEMIDRGGDDVARRRVLTRESPQLLAAGSNVGLRTWESCLRLAYYLCASAEREKVKGSNVLELGAGTGLLSLICSMRLHAKHVVATDGLPHVVQGIEDNITVNREHGHPGESLSMPLARLLNWTDLSPLDEVLTVDGEQVRFDYILGADITYHPELLNPLASLLSVLKKKFPASRILVSTTLRKESTLQLWIDTCRDHGLKAREVNEKEDGWRCPLYRSQTGLFHEQAFPIMIMDIS